MVRNYNIKLTFEGDDTLSTIHANKLNLFVFKSLKANKNGKVLVWQYFDTLKVVDDTTISWDADLGAFVSFELLTSKTDYSSVDSKPIKFGETLHVDTDGNVAKESEGTPDMITIYNENEKQDYTCGISQKDTDGNLAPICAFPLITTYSDVIIPIERVALLFASETQKTATVYEVSRGPGIIVDLTDPKARNRIVTYNRHTGWKADESGESETFKSNSDLSQLLVSVDTNLQNRMHLW
jgi:hypothetical protein